MRPYLRQHLNSVKDKNTRKILDEMESTLADLSTALTQAVGGAAGSDVSGVVTSASVGAAQASSAGLSLVAQSYLVLETDPTLINERSLAVTAPITLTDAGAKGAATIAFDSSLMTTVAPALTLGTTNVAGTGAPFAANATVALFDAVAPADDASAAVHGASLFASDSAHVHRFPTSLMEYTNSKTLTLSSTATVSTLTTGGSVTALVLAGATTLRATTTNTLNFGTSANRILSGWFGTTGINCSGPVTLGSTLSAVSGLASFTNLSVGGEFNPNADLGGSIGSVLVRWGATFTAELNIVDVSAASAFLVELRPESSTALTADRILTLDMVDANRTLKLTGNPTLADWFDQSVKTTASPTFNDVTVTEITSAGASFSVDTDSMLPKTDNLTLLGSSIKRWSKGSFHQNGIAIKDISAAYMVDLNFNSSVTALTADRILTVNMANAARTLTFSGNPTLADWFNQEVKSTSSPSFVGLTLTGTFDVQGNTTVGNATTDTVRFNAGGNASAPSTAAIGTIADYFGSSATRVLTTPNRWWSIVADDGNTYKIPLYT
jgi:hypothetical protein